MIVSIFGRNFPKLVLYEEFLAKYSKNVNQGANSAGSGRPRKENVNGNSSLVSKCFKQFEFSQDLVVALQRGREAPKFLRAF
jgi:hypothetical protein